MAVNPPTNNRGHATLVSTSLLGGTRTLDLTLDGSGTTWPNNYKEAASFTFTVTQVTAGTGAPAIGSALAILVEDAVDAAGNYVTATGGTTLTTGVLAIVDVSAAAAGGTSFTFGSGASRNPALSKFGTFRIVLCVGDTLNNALRATDTTAGADATYHENTDQDNNKKGSLVTQTFGSFVTGTGGIKCKLTAATRTAGNWKYAQAITASFTLKSVIDGTSNPYNDTGAALKNLKVCWSKITGPGASDAVKRQDLAISSAGVISVPATNIDTDWGQALGGDSFYTEIAVGQNFGDASTPAGEKAAIYAIGTTNAADNEQMAYVFANTTQATGFINSSDTNRRLRTSAADQLASAKIRTFSNSGLTSAGVGVFQDSGHTIAQNIFRRTGLVNATNAIPYLRGFLADAYGVALSSIRFLPVIKTQNASPITITQGAPVTSDGSAAVNFNYTVGVAAPAFNRYIKLGAARASGSHVTTGPDSPSSPPATFSVGNGLYTGPFPAYPREVDFNGGAFPIVTGTATAANATSITDSGKNFTTLGVTAGMLVYITAGNGAGGFGTTTTVTATVLTCSGGFSNGNPNNTSQYFVPGTKEPSVITQSVYGVNSEAVVESIWTGPTINATINANGVPTGNGKRSQALGAGSLKTKPAGAINEGNVAVLDQSEFNIKDIAGRSMDLSGGEVFNVARALWSVTTGTAIDAGTALVNGTQMKTPQGYSLGGGTGGASFDTIAAPSDGDAQAYYNGFTESATVRSTFALTTDNSDVGFTTDSGNLGYYRIAVNFFAVDLGIGVALTPQVAQSDPGLTQRVGGHCYRRTNTGVQVSLTPDQAPDYAVYALNPDGTQTQIQSGSMTATATPSDFYVDVAIPIGYQALTVIAFTTISGALTPGGGNCIIQIGYQFDAVGTFVGLQYK